MAKNNLINVWTDGGCRNHGNVRGGHVKNNDSAACAFLVQYPNGVQIHKAAYYKGETNNAMELQGVINALKMLTSNGRVAMKKPPVVINTDSKYVYNAFKLNWVNKWQKKRFHKVKNADRWQVLIRLILSIADVRFRWVKGHADNDGNNFVDKLLNLKMDQVEKIKEARKDEKNQTKAKVNE